jgi:hypothetical protein
VRADEECGQTHLQLAEQEQAMIYCQGWLGEDVFEWVSGKETKELRDQKQEMRWVFIPLLLSVFRPPTWAAESIEKVFFDACGVLAGANLNQGSLGGFTVMVVRFGIFAPALCLFFYLYL